MSSTYYLGVDENGLGARLGPLIVTAVLARVSDPGARFLRRKLPKKLRADLDDSKALVSNKKITLGELWARSLLRATDPETHSPVPLALVDQLSLDSLKFRKSLCPPNDMRQCFSPPPEEFLGSDAELLRIGSHLDDLSARGIEIRRVRSVICCTKRLNLMKEAGIHRFSADLHQMERLLLDAAASLPDESPRPHLVATLGKVGGMNQYSRFFGPLGGRLHSILKESHDLSSYHFPDLGTLHFEKDADQKHPLVMMASLVGKYVREVTMQGIAEFYRNEMALAKDEFTVPSGYHDHVTGRFAQEIAPVRKRLHLVDECFERRRDDPTEAPPKPKTRAKSSPQASTQTKLFP